MNRIFFLLIALTIFSIPLKAQEIYRVTADKLRVRDGKDAKSKVIGNVIQDEKVTVLDASDAKFFKIKFKNVEGWASKDFLEQVAEANPATAPQTTAQTPTTNSTNSNGDIYKVTADNLRVREKADPKSKVIGYLPENENVAVLDSTDNSFFKIRVTNGEGWVSRAFLVRISPVKPAVQKTGVSVDVPKIETGYSNIIFFAIVALVMGTILYFIFKYSSQNKILIGISAMVVLVVIYFCFVTFIQEKKVSGRYVSDSETQYQTFDFGANDSVVVKDVYTDSTFTAKYVIEGDMIKLYDQQNMILLLIRDENTLIGEGFTRGTFTKK
ncbi:SH3 domain-containing protein [Pedobacter sandarakinus]|uniref:SH3 domain-containing protein n=1 Tax=Pedobacter sandarakinus TaxID=353156 RepID=UPI00224722ED|nr:SH3 domain-containing protein [Pedobacter sandarakinus]MCX2574607.1 SH3 domain-containing protein [Pedobacter sandarakinus]